MTATAPRAAAALLLIAGLAAGSPRAAWEAAAPAPAASQAAASVAQVHRFKIGDLDAWALLDGYAEFPNDNQVLGVGRTREEVTGVLTAAGLPTDKFALSIQPLLVRSGKQLVLFDAGAGAAFGPGAGKLPQSLRAAGIDPATITDVAISHSHGDHVVGLVRADGALSFPNARIHMAAAEWAFLRANPKMAALAKAIAPKVAPFQPRAQIAPGVTAVDLSGHTPGHSGYEVVSRGQRLLYVGDTMHHYVVSVQRPDWANGFDTDAPPAMARRRATLARASDENLLVYAVHFPFPGLGHVRRRGESFVWEPLR